MHTKRLKQVMAIIVMTFLVISTVMPSFTATTFASEEEPAPEVVLDAEEVAEEPQEEVIVETPVEEEETEETESEPSSEIEEENVDPQEQAASQETPLEEQVEEPEEEPSAEPNEETSTEIGEEEPASTEEVEKPKSEDVSEKAMEEHVGNNKPADKSEPSLSVFNYIPLMKVFTPKENSILAYPLVKRALITYGFGSIDELHQSGHSGVDFAISTGTEVLAAEKGTVIKAEYFGGYGNCVFIQHKNGLETRYAHLSEVNVLMGEEVKRGQQVGRVGSTGRSTGPHLHFEVLENKVLVDPMTYLENEIEISLDFSSKRLIVRGSEEALNGEPVIATLGGVSLVQYKTAEDAKSAYVRLIKTCDAVEVDSVMSIAEGEESGASSEMSEAENPFVEAQEVVTENEVYDVAVIDTGSNNADKILSVLGDDGTDRNGHGQRMIDLIKELSPDAKILSIKAVKDNGVGDVSSVYSAIKLAIAENVKVINLSISAVKNEDSFVIEEVIKEAVDKGITVIGSAGNNGISADLFVPASIEEAIIVGTIDGATNFGDTVDYIVDVEVTSKATAIVTGLFLNGTLSNYNREIRISEELDENKEDAVAGNRVFEVEQNGKKYLLTEEEFALATNYYENLKSSMASSMPEGFVTTASTSSTFELVINSGLPTAPGWEPWSIGIEYSGNFYNWNSRLSIGVGQFNGSHYFTDSAAEYFKTTDGTTRAYCANFFTTDYPRASIAGNDISTHNKFTAADSQRIALMLHYFENKTDLPHPYGIALSQTYVWTEIAKELMEMQGAGTITYPSIVIGNLTDAQVKSYHRAAANYASQNPDKLKGTTILYWDSQSASNHWQPMVSYKTEPMPDGTARLTKTSSNTNLTNGNSCYNMNGITYKVYKNSGTFANPVKSTDTGKTLVLSNYNASNSRATSNTITLEAGEYVVQEVQSSTVGTGYAYNGTLYPVTVRSGELSNIPVTDAPTADPNQLRIYKAGLVDFSRIDHATAVFKVEYFPNNNWSGSPTRTWYYKTIDGITRLGQAAYLDTSKNNSALFTSGGTVVFPLGTIKVTEETAPAGYIKGNFALQARVELNSNNEAEFKWTSGASSGNLIYESDGTPSYLNPAIPPTVRTTARDTSTNSHIGAVTEQAEIIDDVTFTWLPKGSFDLVATLRYADTGEIVKGLDGEDCIVKTVVNVDYTTTEATQNGDGSWNAPQNATISMPAFTFDATGMDGKTLVVTEEVFEHGTDTLVVEHYNLEDENQSIHFPEVLTEAKDSKTGTRTAVVGETEKIIDIVTINNAVIGETYTIKGTLVYKDDCTTEDGVSHTKGEVIAEQLEDVIVTADAETITAEVVFEVDSSKLSGISGTVFEDVYSGDVLVAVHHDYDAEEQTPNFPKVRTTAVDGKTLGHAGVSGETTIVDTVSLTNLNIGDTYKVKGILMTQDGEPLLSNGEEVTQETEPFVATQKNMTVELTFTFTAEEGTSTVVYEKLYAVIEKETADTEGTPVVEEEEIEVSRHEDPTDEGQTVDYPTGHTEAKDSRTETHMTLAGEEATVIDRFYFENLNTNEKYTIEATLVDKETLKPVAKVTIEDFQPEEKNGYIDIVFNFNAKELEGKTLVAFETTSLNGVIVIDHRNPEDEEQTIYVPKIRTSARDKKDGDNLITFQKEQTIIDTVKYENLIPNKEYEAVLTVFDKTTGQLVSGIEVRKKFTSSETGSGELEIEVTVDGQKLSGHVLVMFEEIYFLESPENPVGEHKDPEDKEQTIIVDSPKVNTGDESNVNLYLGTGSMATILLLVMLYRKKKESL